MTNKKRILSVTLKRMVDDSPDTSWLGEYSNRSTSEFSIDRAHSEDCIENDSIQKDKLERIESAIENDRPLCEDHTDVSDTDCEVCQEEKDYSNAMVEVSDLRECDCSGGDMERHQYRYFNPSFNYVDKQGHALPENTPEEVRKYVRQDYERMEDLNKGHWCFMGIGTEAQVSIPSGSSSVTSKVSSGFCFGVESDAGQTHIDEMEQEQLYELKTQLKSLGFSSRAISQAFKNIERKED